MSEQGARVILLQTLGRVHHTKREKREMLRFKVIYERTIREIIS